MCGSTAWTPATDVPQSPADFTLSASRRFAEDVAAIASTLRARGFSVHTPRFGDRGREDELDAEAQQALTLEFLEKIAAADTLLIVNPGGYVGTSVALEVGHAHALGKRVVALEPSTEPAVDALVAELVDPATVEGR